MNITEARDVQAVIGFVVGLTSWEHAECRPGRAGTLDEVALLEAISRLATWSRLALAAGPTGDESFAAARRAGIGDF